MTSVKARKLYPRPVAPGRRDFGHVASFAHRGNNIPRQVFSYRRALIAPVDGSKVQWPGHLTNGVAMPGFYLPSEDEFDPSTDDFVLPSISKERR